MHWVTLDAALTDNFRDEFVRNVRQGRIPQPQQLKFTREAWVKSFKSIPSPTLADRRLYKCGLWIDGQLTLLRGALVEARINTCPRALRIRSAVAIANRELRAVQEQSAQRLKKSAKSHPAVPMDALRYPALKVESTSEVYTPDEIVTVTVDSAVYPLDQAIHDNSSDALPKVSAKAQLVSLRKAFQIGNAYHMFVDFWLDCLWQGSYLYKSEGRLFLAPSNIDEAKNFTASKYRQETWHHANIVGMLKFWTRLSDALRKQIASSRKMVVGINKRGSKRKFVLRDDARDLSFPPSWFLHGAQTDINMAELFFDESLPNFPDLTIRKLLGVWEILKSLASTLDNSVPNSKAMSLDQLLEFAPLLKKQELIDVITRGLAENEVANEIIRFLTYSPRSQNMGGLWSRPLVEVRENTYVLVSPALLVGNVQRCIEFWLKLGGVEFEDKGAEFEHEVRSAISDALAKSRKLEDTFSATSAIFFETEEIDVLFRIGRKIFVGEVKSHIFPSDPIEIHNYYAKVLDDGTEQAKRKAKVCEDKIDEVRSLTKCEDTNGSVLEVIPVVITNLAIGSGAQVNGVPIVDLRFLERFLEYGSFEFFFTVEPTGESSSATEVEAYADQSEFESKCRSLLNQQPILAFYADHAKLRLRPIPVGKGLPAVYAYFEVDLREKSEEILKLFAEAEAK